MGYTKSYARFTYKNDPDWKDPASFWRFRGDYGDLDDELATDLTQASIVGQLDPVELDKVRKDPDKLAAYLRSKVDRRQFISVKRALLLTMTIEWGGEDMRVPADYQDDSRPAIGEDEQGEPIYPVHPDAGTIPPVTAFWVGQQKPEVINRVHAALQQHIEGRSQEEQATFHRRDSGVDESGRDQSGAQEAPGRAPRASRARPVAKGLH